MYTSSSSGDRSSTASRGDRTHKISCAAVEMSLITERMPHPPVGHESVAAVVIS